MTESPRRLAREIVLQALYAGNYGNEDPVTALGSLLEENPLPDKQVRFANRLFSTVQRKSDWADEQIERLAVNWDIRRIAGIDLVILRMALVELEEIDETPVRVVLNEAIELAKKFSTRESSGFVNGILDAYVKQRA